MKTITELSLIFITAVLVVGCASSGVKNPSGVGVTRMNADEQGFVAGTGVESQDLVAVAEKMARSILGVLNDNANTPSAMQIKNTPPVVVLDPVVNKTRFPINKDIFLTRIRVQLNSSARGKLVFLARDRMDALEKERNLKREGAVTSSSDAALREFEGADFFLTGSLEGLSTRTKAGTSDYILYAFQLINARTSVIVWEDSSEIKKQGLEDAAYR